MRSVTTKPPTTLIAPKTTAIRPRIVAIPPPPTPATRIAPTIDDAVNRVRAGHQRRVQHRRHLRDDFEADEDRECEHGQLVDQLRCSLHELQDGGMDDGAAAADEAAGDHVVVRGRARRAVLAAQRQQFGDVAGVQPGWRATASQRRGCGRRRWSRSSRTTVSPGSVSSQLPPASAARSTITEPGRMAATISAVISRRGPARDQGGGDDDVAGGDVLGEQLALRRSSSSRELLRVAAGRSPASGSSISRTSRRGSRPARARRGRTSNALTTAPRRRAVAIACRPATPAPEHQHLRGRHGAGRGHEQREVAREQGRREQHGAVAGDVACEESASIVCARVMRGTSSIASALRPRRRAPGSSRAGPAGRRNEISSTSAGRTAISSSLGGATRKPTSAPARAASASATSRPRSRA